MVGSDIFETLARWTVSVTVGIEYILNYFNNEQVSAVVAKSSSRLERNADL